jgi:hypothetical protein
MIRLRNIKLAIQLYSRDNKLNCQLESIFLIACDALVFRFRILRPYRPSATLANSLYS